MGIGADKIIAYDPPGAIGLDRGRTYHDEDRDWDEGRDAVVLIRFNEVNNTDFPADEAGGLNDLSLVTGLAQPVVVPAAVGRGRQFNAGTTSGYVATDRVSGSTLLTRDMSVQMILSFNMANQIAYGTPAQIVKRGKGNNWGASERESFAINASHVAVPAGDCDLHWEWETVAGALKVQAGVVFTPPPAGKFTLVTMTRRWVSPTKVVLRHYVGDVLIGEVISADGDIGGSTLGTTGIGSVGQAGGAGYGRTFASGILDELMILGRELSLEEIEATWLRLTKYQPFATRLFLEMHDPGFPMSNDPASDVQLDTRMIGQTMGYAAATAENLRANFLPGRAYGTTLDQWEELTRATQAHADHNDDDLGVRRARVLGRLRQRRGISILGIQDALQGLIGAATVGDLDFIAFNNTITDPFTTLDLLRWDVTPAASWTAFAGVARSSPGAGTYTFDGTTQNWRYAQMSVGGQNGKAMHILSQVSMTLPQANLEVGIFVGDRASGNYLLWGLKDVAGVFSVSREHFVAGVSQGAAALAVFGANPSGLWLHMHQQEVNPLQWTVGYSLTSGTTGFVDFTVTGDIAVQWAGFYMRSIGAIGGAAIVDIDDFVMREPFGTRTLNAYVMLDQALGFTPDILGAQSVIAAIKHAFTHATFITRPVLLCDDSQSGCDLGPLGGY